MQSRQAHAPSDESPGSAACPASPGPASLPRAVSIAPVRSNAPAADLLPQCDLPRPPSAPPSASAASQSPASLPGSQNRQARFPWIEPSSPASSRPTAQAPGSHPPPIPKSLTTAARKSLLPAVPLATTGAAAAQPELLECPQAAGPGRTQTASPEACQCHRSPASIPAQFGFVSLPDLAQ